MDFGSIADWALVFVTMIGIPGIVFQLNAVHKQLVADHDRSRRELCASSLRQWTEGTKLESTAIAEFLNVLTPHQCELIAKRQSVSISNNDRNQELLKRCLDFRYPSFDINTTINGGSINIDADHASFIRHHAVYYLNLIESTLAPWSLRIALEELIEEEFQFLLTEHQDLGTFRTAAQSVNGGVDVWPIISEFIREQSKKPRKRLAVVVAGVTTK